MWFLTSQYDKRVINIAPQKSKVTLGRSIDPGTCDFSIPDDASISRKHATLSLSGNNLVVTDLGSKYGTFVNQPSDQKKGIEKDVPKILQVDDTIRFGAITCIWKVNKVDFVTCASTLKGENLQTLKSLLGQLGGTFKTEWDNTCSHLTMPAITLTIKVVNALVQGAYIVTLDYWRKCCEAIIDNTEIPDAKDFLPDVIESTLNKDMVSFTPNLKRSKIFAGKKVVFLSRRQMEMYKNVLTQGSATPMLLSESKMSKSMLSAPDVIVIQYIINSTSQDTQALQTQINAIVDHLKSKNKRVIADAEIGLAILYCSLDKYCNPDFNFSSEVLKETTDSQHKNKTANILAQETQDSTKSNGTVKVEVIDESLASMNDDTINSSGKRKFNKDNEESVENAQKKIATEKNVSSSVAMDDNSQELFNFIEPQPSNNTEDDSDKKLNLSKPLKRKQDQLDDEDNLFNFISEKKQKPSDEPSAKIFDEYSYIKEEPIAKKTKFEEINETIDYSALFGKTIKTLLESNISWKSRQDIIKSEIKKEDITEELEDRINNINLGTTVVTIKTDLIKVEKTENIEQQISNGKNFKRFKKIWPLKIQVTIIPESSMTTIKPDASAIADVEFSDNEDEKTISKPSVQNEQDYTISHPAVQSEPLKTTIGDYFKKFE